MAIQPRILDAVSPSQNMCIRYNIQHIQDTNIYYKHVGQKKPEKQTEGERKQLIKEC